MDLTLAVTSIAGAVIAAGFLGFALERIMEVFVTPVVPEQYQKYTIYGTLALGILGAVAFGLDAVTPTLESMGWDPTGAMTDWAGTLLTGVIIGGGSNLIHDLWPGSSARNGERV